MTSLVRSDNSELNRILSVGNWRSSPSRETVSVRFLNFSPKSIDLFWIDFQGAIVRYARIAPKQYCDVSTFVGHPWIFRVSNNGATALCLTEQGIAREVFWPEKKDPFLRVSVPIFLGLNSLRDTAALLVADLCSTLSSAAELPLPALLLEQVLYYILRREAYRAFVTLR